MKAEELTWNEFENLNKESVAIVPVGSLEQHGMHLPLGNDSLVAQKFAEKVSEEINAVVFPPINYGFVYTFGNFPGSVGVRPETLINMIYDIGESIIREGFKKILFLNSHDENQEPIIIAAKKLSKDLGISPIVVEWAHIAQSDLRKIKESNHEMHAGETLTSLFLYWFPNLVKKERMINDFPNTIKMVEDNLFKEGNQATWVHQFTISDVPSGTCGNPSLGTVEKGIKIEKIVLNNIRTLLKDMGWC